jgi:predicted transcriptional regulator
MQLHTWDQKVHTTLYIERRHLDALDEIARKSGIARQWVLREILEQALNSETFQVIPARVSL